MDRRTFLAFAAAGVVWRETRKAHATTVKQFRISRADYRKIEAEYLPQLVEYSTAEAPGTIIVDPEHRFLYLILGPNQAKRYGIGVGREGFEWSGTAAIRRKAEWPKWIPPKEMVARDPKAAQWPDGMPGGPDNPLGARALYLYQGEVDTLFRIHGTPEPDSIGRAVSSGCIRMLNADVAELYDRVELGAKVVVLPVTGMVAQVEETPLEEPPAAAAQDASGGPVVPSADRQRAIRATFARRRELRRQRRKTVEDWLRSLDDGG